MSIFGFERRKAYVMCVDSLHRLWYKVQHTSNRPQHHIGDSSTLSFFKPLWEHSAHFMVLTAFPLDYSLLVLISASTFGTNPGPNPRKLSHCFFSGSGVCSLQLSSFAAWGKRDVAKHLNRVGRGFRRCQALWGWSGSRLQLYRRS